MEKSLLKRLEALEKKSSSDVFIFAETSDGAETVARVRDVLTSSGELREGFSGIGKDLSIVTEGKSLKDIDRILSYLRTEAEKEEEEK